MNGLKDELLRLKASHKAILAVNFYNYETLSGILRAVKSMKVPVILQLSEGTIDYLGLDIAYALARTALKSYDVKGWIHLDHGKSIELVKKCLDQGFDSVMIDASEQPFDENVKITRQVMKMAEPYGANVEAELGYVAKLGQKQIDRSGFTTVEDAVKFVNNTGVTTLAVSIGSAHGFYKEDPNLDIHLLNRIHRSVATPLVLHGSSGIPDGMLQESIRNGISKINLATETKNTFMLSLKKSLQESDEIDLRKVFPTAIGSVTELITRKLKVLDEA